MSVQLFKIPVPISYKALEFKQTLFVQYIITIVLFSITVACFIELT